MSFYGFRPYVPVAQRRLNAARELAKLTEMGDDDLVKLVALDLNAAMAEA